MPKHMFLTEMPELWLKELGETSLFDDCQEFEEYRRFKGFRNIRNDSDYAACIAIISIYVVAIIGLLMTGFDTVTTVWFTAVISSVVVPVVTVSVYIELGHCMKGRSF
jgi:uncharacterized protein (DUF983 family)